MSANGDMSSKSIVHGKDMNISSIPVSHVTDDSFIEQMRDTKLLSNKKSSLGERIEEYNKPTDLN